MTGKNKCLAGMAGVVLVGAAAWLVIAKLCQSPGSSTALAAPAATQPTSSTAAPAPTPKASATRPAPASRPAIMKNPSRQAIFSALTSHTWTTMDPARKQSGMIDYYVSQYNPDSTFAIEHITDYVTPPRKGRWNLAYGPPGSWYLCHDTGYRARITLLADGSLPWWPEKELPAQSRFTADTLPVLTMPDEVKTGIEKLTANPWKRANDLDLDHYPTSVVFNKDMGYVSSYRNGEVENRGGWYASYGEGEHYGGWSAYKKIQIQGQSPTNPRGPSKSNPDFGEQLDVDLLQDGNALIGHELYVPADRPVKRGTVWGIFGHTDTVRVSVEYDMPVRKGVPNRFDITITNPDKLSHYGPLTLQRFSVTKTFDHGYRQADKTLAKVDEIGGLDLGQFKLKAEQSKTYSLTVTFPESGKQRLYLNAMITVPAFALDTRHSYLFDIRE